MSIIGWRRRTGSQFITCIFRDEHLGIRIENGVISLVGEQAVAKGLRVGDRFHTVCGRSVEYRSDKEVTALIRRSKRPLKIVFERKGLSSEAAAAKAALVALTASEKCFLFLSKAKETFYFTHSEDQFSRNKFILYLQSIGIKRKEYWPSSEEEWFSTKRLCESCGFAVYDVEAWFDHMLLSNFATMSNLQLDAQKITDGTKMDSKLDSQVGLNPIQNKFGKKIVTTSLDTELARGRQIMREKKDSNSKSFNFFSSKAFPHFQIPDEYAKKRLNLYLTSVNK